MGKYSRDAHLCVTNGNPVNPVIEILSEGRWDKLHGRNGLGHIGKIRVMEDLSYTEYPDCVEFKPPPILIYGFCESNMNKEVVSPAGFALSYETAQALHDAIGKILSKKVPDKGLE